MAEVLTQTGTNYGELFARAKERLASEPSWLKTRRAKSFEHFNRLGFPAANHEDWRYTSLQPITSRAFAPTPVKAFVEPQDFAEFSYEGLAGNWIALVDGNYRSSFSQVRDLPKGVIVCSFKEALEKHGPLVEKYLGRLTSPETQAFTALNEALAEDGVFIYVPRNAVIEQPLHIVHFASREAQGSVSHTRSLWVLEESSQVTIIETHGANDESEYFRNVLTEVFLGENANLDHYVVQRESTQSNHVSTMHFHQERSSIARSHTFDFGGGLVRHNIWGDLDGGGCEAIVNGLYVLRGNQHVDNFMWMEHRKENIPSHELYKGVLDDDASAVFTGRIYVHPEAQKTDAKQTNQALLLSENARVVAKPQLEIYADDVKCTHGSTVGQLDPTARFYCESRGIDRDTARKLLVHAFASDVVERVRLEPVRNKVLELLTARLEKDQSSNGRE